MSASAPILVASDDAGDAELVRRMLRKEFSQVQCSTDPARAVADFEAQRPQVLVLAFDALERAERHYLGLYRRSEQIHALPHRTVILCNKDELNGVYELCRKQQFDDYVLFWPLNHDAPRLLMAVHQALRQLAGDDASAPTVAEFAAQARRLASLEELLEGQAVLARADDPVRELLAPPLQSVRALQSLAARVRPQLLLVDDDPYQHKLVHRLLNGEPYELRSVHSAVEALAALRRHRFDAVLMDLDMPEVDGVEATRRIRAVDAHAELPVLMVTGHSDKDAVLRCAQAGAAGFVVKPFDKSTLLAKLRAALDGAPTPPA